jgi:hypothetical protein
MRTMFVAFAAFVALAFGGAAIAGEGLGFPVETTSAQDAPLSVDTEALDPDDSSETESTTVAVTDVASPDDASPVPVGQTADDDPYQDRDDDVPEPAEDDESTEDDEAVTGQELTQSECDETEGDNFGQARRAQVECYRELGETPPPAWTHPLHPGNAGEAGDAAQSDDEVSTERDEEDGVAAEESTEDEQARGFLAHLLALIQDFFAGQDDGVEDESDQEPAETDADDDESTDETDSTDEGTESDGDETDSVEDEGTEDDGVSDDDTTDEEVVEEDETETGSQASTQSAEEDADTRKGKAETKRQDDGKGNGNRS